MWIHIVIIIIILVTIIAFHIWYSDHMSDCGVNSNPSLSSKIASRPMIKFGKFAKSKII